MATAARRWHAAAHLRLVVLVACAVGRCAPATSCYAAQSCADYLASGASLSVGVDDTAGASAAYHACGVVELRGAAPTGVDDAFRAFESSPRLAEALESRSRVRDALRWAMADGANLRDLFEGRLRHEPLFAAGDWLRERHDGRIDVDVDVVGLGDLGVLAAVRNATAAVSRAVLGDDHVLRSARLVVALPGAQDQHWHRDAPPLFDDVAVPPYALNLMVPLVDVDLGRGPTSFLLGSHAWPSTWPSRARNRRPSSIRR